MKKMIILAICGILMFGFTASVNSAPSDQGKIAVATRAQDNHALTSNRMVDNSREIPKWLIADYQSATPPLIASYALSEGFEVSVPPATWSEIVTDNNDPTFNWYQRNDAPGLAIEGAAWADVVKDTNTTVQQDEWLITPTIDFSTSFTSGDPIRLDFYWFMSYYWAIDPYDNYDLEVYISTDDGANWTMLWEEADYGVFTTWAWNKTTLDLSSYAGETQVKIAWRYYGMDGAEAAVDWVTLNDSGEDTADPFIVPFLPYEDIWYTTGYANDYANTLCGSSDSNDAPDVVYSFTPADDIFITIDLCNSEYDTRLFVYEDATEIACNDEACGDDGHKSKLVGVPTNSGHTYYIVVDGYGNLSGDYDLIITRYYPCDLTCPTPNVPEGEPECYDGYVDDYNGGCNMDEPAFTPVECGQTICGTSGTFITDGNNFRDTDWYLFTLTERSQVTITTQAEFQFGMLLSFASCEDYNEFDYVTALPCVETVMGPWDLDAGDYYIAYVPSAFTGVDCGREYYFTVACDEPHPAPANDLCENVEPIVLQDGIVYQTTGNFLGATANCDYFGIPLVWEAFTIPAGICMDVRVDFCRTSPSFDLVWIIMMGCPCDLPIAIYSGIDWNGCGDGNPYIYFDGLTAGTYYLPVVSQPYYGPPSGDYTFDVVGTEYPCPEAPPNDDCANAIPLTNPVVDFAFSNTGATTDNDGQCGSDLGADIWYIYTAECSGTATASLCDSPSDFDTKMAVYGGTCGNPGTVLACDDDGCAPGGPSEATFDVTEGNEYLICIGGWSGAQGDGILNITCESGGECYQYVPGDANMMAGIWKPTIIGGDVTYMVGYFRGINLPCLLGGFFCAADANGDCNVIGSDVTKMVAYFRGLTQLSFCPDYEPCWPTPADAPDTEPPGWPPCE